MFEDPDRFPIPVPSLIFPLEPKNSIPPERIVATPVTSDPPTTSKPPLTVNLSVGFVVPIPTFERVLIPTEVLVQLVSPLPAIVTLPVDADNVILSPATNDVTIPLKLEPDPKKPVPAVTIPDAERLPFTDTPVANVDNL